MVFFRSQSRIPVSLVRTLTDCVMPHMRLMIVAEKLVEEGLKSPEIHIRRSGCLKENS